jgi:hypothetical protein
VKIGFPACSSDHILPISSSFTAAIARRAAATFRSKRLRISRRLVSFGDW